MKWLQKQFPKMVCLLFSLSLWVYLNSSQYQFYDMTLPIQYNTEQGWEVVSGQSHIKLQIKAPKAFADSLYRFEKEIVIPIKASRKQLYRLKESELLLPRNFDLVDYKPKKFTIRQQEKRVEKKD